MYSDLAALYERAGCIRGRPGTLTQLPILTMPGDDIGHPIPDLTGYITEGQIVLDRELDRRGIYPPVRVLPSLSRLMDAGIGEGFTDPDHPALAHQLFAAYARALRVRVLASVMGEQGLPESDRRFLAFGDRFERQFVHQERALTLEESLEAGWAVLRGLPVRRTHAAVERADRPAPREPHMPEAGEVAATRVALLELRDERRLVQEGYELLDEKRVLLATEIAAPAARARRAPGDRSTGSGPRRAQALAQAIEVHGFDDLTVEPPCSLDTALLRQDQRSFLGIALVEAHLRRHRRARPCALPVRATPELKRCAAAFRALAVSLAGQAARGGNLRRLIAEYRRTERRARALENVLLPEIDRSLHFIEEQLDAVDQEEAVRVRNAARGR